MDNQFKEYILKYAIIASKRFTKKEKIRYLNNIEKDFKSMKYETSILSPVGGKGKSMDLIIGNVKKAKTIIIANFDTPIKSFNLYKYKPFNVNFQRNTYFTTVFVTLLLLCVLCFIYTVQFVHLQWFEGIFKASDFVNVAIYLLFIYCICKCSKGLPNRKNVNRNSSGVVALLQLANYFKDKPENNIAFVLTDYGCINHNGDMMIKEYLKGIDKKNVIMLDSIGKGTTLAVNYSSSMQNIVKQLPSRIKKYPCDMKEYSMANLYKNCLIFSRGTVGSKDFYVPNVSTSKDNDIDLENIDELCKIFQQINY